METVLTIIDSEYFVGGAFMYLFVLFVMVVRNNTRLQDIQEITLPAMTEKIDELSTTDLYQKLSAVLEFPAFARHQIALKCNSMRGVYERQTIYRRI
jgi:hypothetical protein